MAKTVFNGNKSAKGKGFDNNPQNINREGRPPKLPQLDVLLDEVLGEEKDGVSAAKVILMALRKKATAGDVRAAEILLDRAFGKAKQEINSTVNMQASINIPIAKWDGDNTE